MKVCSFWFFPIFFSLSFIVVCFFFLQCSRFQFFSPAHASFYLFFRIIFFILFVILVLLFDYSSNGLFYFFIFPLHRCVKENVKCRWLILLLILVGLRWFLFILYYLKICDAIFFIFIIFFASSILDFSSLHFFLVSCLVHFLYYFIQIILNNSRKGKIEHKIIIYRKTI